MAIILNRLLQLLLLIVIREKRVGNYKVF